MSEMIIAGILLTFCVVFLTSYIILIELRKNQKLQKVNKQGREISCVEKELDRTDAIKRGLNILKAEHRQIIK
jgi:hypothetical protein